MFQVLAVLFLFFPFLRGPSIDPAGGKTARRTIASDNGSCIDPDGRCVRATSSLSTDKGLGVDPNG